MKYILLWLVLACGQTPHSNVGMSEAASKRQVWFKSAAELENQMRSWRLYVSKYERSLYFSTLGVLYGSPDINQLEVLLTEPNSGYVLAIDIVANWLSGKLIQLQSSKGTGYLFNGSYAPPDENNCYASKATWCDYHDEIVLGMFSRSQPPTTEAQRKRVMHNIQDMGDFLGITIDNLLSLKKSGLPQRHVPQYLLEEVFIPHLIDKDDTAYLPENTITDYVAWQKVTQILLMSGQFFMHLNLRRQ